jgi:RimJ/RimL family protein N-acetyltransferase
MKLRKLKTADVPRIYDWMKDPEINQFFRFNADDMTLDSVTQYVQQAQDTKYNLHLAVVDDHDQYLGTVSLKDIDEVNRKAEYAICMRKEAQGTCAAVFATSEILKIAFLERNLNRVYLNVLSDNLRANRFYEKFGFFYEGEFKEHLMIRGVLKNLKWYRLLKNEYEIKQ